jgi:hypothetical protein
MRVASPQAQLRMVSSSLSSVSQIVRSSAGRKICLQRGQRTIQLAASTIAEGMPRSIAHVKLANL